MVAPACAWLGCVFAACVPSRPTQTSQPCARDEQCPADGRHFCNVRTAACEPCDGPCATVTVLDVASAGSVAAPAASPAAADAGTLEVADAKVAETAPTVATDATPGDAGGADGPDGGAADVDSLDGIAPDVSAPDAALPADTTEPAWKPSGKDYWDPTESCKDHCDDLGPPGCYCDSFCLTAEPSDCCNDKKLYCPATD